MVSESSWGRRIICLITHDRAFNMAELQRDLLDLALVTAGDPVAYNYDLSAFLKEAVPRLSSRIGCIGGCVFKESGEKLLPIYLSIPENDAEQISIQLQSAIRSGTDARYHFFSRDGVNCYIFPLRVFGYLLLVHQEQFDAPTLESLQIITSLLANTCQLFLQSERARHSEESLKRERNLLRAIIDNIPDPIYVKDIEGRKILLNKAEADILNVGSIEEALGKRDSDFYPPEVVEKTTEEDQKIIREKTAKIHEETQFVNGKGENVWLDSNKIPYLGEDGNVLGTIGISHNITRLKQSELDLKRNVEKYMAIFNSFMDLYYQTDIQGNIITLSPSVFELSGYRPEELIGRNDAEIYVDIQSRNKMVQLLIEKGAINDYENLLKRKDGQFLSVSITSHLIKDEQGRPKYIEGTLRDITERKNAVAKMAVLLNLQKLITHLATEFINIPVESSDESVNHMLALIGEEIQVDRVYIFSYNFSTGLMSNTHEWCAPGITSEMENLQQIPMSGVPDWIDTHVKGEMLIVENVGELDQGSPLREILEPQSIKTLITIPMILNEQCLGFVGFDSVKQVKTWSKEEITFLQLLADLLCNITDRKDTEERLKTREAYLKAVFNNVPYLMWLKDVDGRYQLVNKPFLDYFSFTEKDSPIGRNAEEIWSADISKIFREQDNAVIRTKESQYLETEISFHGKKVWFEIYRAPIFAPDGRIIGTTGIARDITHRIAADAELKKAKADAESSNIAKTRFLANMSHEIRTPLNAIIGMLRLLKEAGVGDEQVKLVDNMKISSENLLSIINNILDFSKIESGQMELGHSVFNLSELVRRVYDSNEFRAEEKGLKLMYRVDKAIKPTIKGDPVRLQQILTNLVSNAIKFTREGMVELRAESSWSSSGKEQITFSVEDTGIGISPEHQQRIFHSFQQEDESITRTYGGTGLGLAISRQLVEIMGGKLAVKSEKNRGSTFFFTIEFEVEDAAEGIPEGREVAADKTSLKGYRVLLVEDNKFNQFIAQAILEKWGLVVTIAEHGKEALEKVGQSTFDLILMDIQMPEMDGLTASTIIRKELKIETPILALTANVVLGIVERCEAAGMQGYISKPFDEDELFQKILSVMNVNATQISGEDTSQVVIQDDKDTGNEQIADLSGLQNMIGNDAGMIRRMVEKFLEVTPEYIQELADAAAKHDISAIERHSHKLKSSVKLVANQKVTSLIETINEIGKTGKEPEDLYPMIDHFIACFKILQVQLREKLHV